MEAGEIANQIAFLTEGVFRLFYFTKIGQETTRYFIQRNSFLIETNSFGSGLTSSEYLEAVTKAKMLIFDPETLTMLLEKEVVWKTVLSKINIRVNAKKVSNANNHFEKDPYIRYRNFMNINPDLAEKIPMSMISSYLNLPEDSRFHFR